MTLFCNNLPGILEENPSKNSSYSLTLSSSNLDKKKVTVRTSTITSTYTSQFPNYLSYKQEEKRALDQVDQKTKNLYNNYKKKRKSCSSIDSSFNKPLKGSIRDLSNRRSSEPLESTSRLSLNFFNLELKE